MTCAFAGSVSMQHLFRLIAAPLDDTVKRDYQDELYLIEESSQGLGSPVYDRSQLTAGTVPLPYLGEFITKVLQPSAVTGLAGLIGAWMQVRRGRKVRVRVGNMEVDASTADEVESLLEKARIMNKVS